MNQKKLEQVRKDTEEVQKMLMGEDLKFTVEWHKNPAEFPTKSGKYLVCTRNGTIKLLTLNIEEHKAFADLILLWAEVPIPPKIILEERRKAKIKSLQEQIEKLESKLQEIT